VPAAVVVPAKAGTQLRRWIPAYAGMTQLRTGSSIFCAVAMLAADVVAAAEWTLTPSGRVATAYIDNPHLLEDGGEATSGTIAALAMVAQRRTERLDWTFEPRLRSSRYQDDDSLDSDDRSLRTQLGFATERSYWNASADLIRDTTLTSELGATGLVQANRRHRSLALSLGPSFSLTERLSAGAQAYFLDSRYSQTEDTALTDYQYESLSVYAKFATTERSDFSLVTQGGELEPEQGGRTRDLSVRLAWTYAPHALWTAKVSAGPSYVDTDLRTDTGAVLDADLQRQGERWTFSSGVARMLVPTGRGVLTRRDRAGFGVSHRTTERLSCSLLAQWLRNEDVSTGFSDAARELEYGRLEATFDWKFSQHWSLALTLAAATQEYDDRPSGADTQRASLSVVWNGRPHSL
jgi:hypothetical protein